MENTTKLRMLKGRGWWMGFANLFHANNTKWWHTKKWIIQTVFWLLFINGLLAVMIWALPAEKVLKEFASLGTIKTMDALQQNLLAGALINFLVYYAFALPVGAIIAGQDSIIGERQAGTAAWVLSKPVSRLAFILSKLAASTIGMLIIAVVIQGMVAYIQLSFRMTSGWPHAFPVIFFRESDAGHGYSVSATTDGRVSLARSAGGSPREIASSMVLGLSSDTNLDFKLDANGAWLRAWLNGSLVIDYTDPDPLLDGRVRIRTQDGSLHLSDLSLAPLKH